MAPAAGVINAGWCEPEHLLTSVFGFTHVPASQLQSKAHVLEFCGLLKRFTTQKLHVKDATSGSTLWTDLTPQDAQALCKATAATATDRVTWFPEYGCALLALGDPPSSVTEDFRTCPDGLTLQLVCLDKWGFWMHSTPQGMQRTATSDGHTVLYCGAVPHGDYTELIGRIRALEAKGLSQRVNSNQKGFQRTPAYIHAVACTALAGSDAAVVTARGGFTDVGQHTGGDVVRDTCWPLVKAVLQVHLEDGLTCDGEQQPSLLFRQVMAHLDLWLLRRQIDLLSPATAAPTMVTAVMQMLRSATDKAASLADDGYDMCTFETACCAVEARMRELVGERALAAARVLELPPHGSTEELGAVTLPSGVLPAVLATRENNGGLEAARQRSTRNLGTLPLLPPGASFGQMLAQLSCPQWTTPSGDAAAQLALRSVEREFFRRASDGLAAPANRLCDEEAAALERVVDSYRAGMQRYLQTPAAKATMRVELLSRELLVVWIGYCLLHAAAGREHPIVLRYGCLGNYQDLRHLVLSDAVAVNAALAVSAYLQQHAVTARELFSLRDDGAATMSMALEYAQGCPQLQRIWAAEQRDAEVRVQGHWAEVQRKQRLAAELREQLLRLQAEGEKLAATLWKREQALRDAQAAQASWDAVLHRAAVSSAQLAVNAARSNASFNKSQQSTVRTQLAEAEKAPPPVIQPLPETAAHAYRWLLFLHMPPALRRLSRASFLAQQMLLPRPCSGDVVKALETQFRISLVQHYNSYRQVTKYRSGVPLHQSADGTDGRVMLKSASSAPQAKDIGPKLVDECTTPQHGVWYPDGLSPAMAWAGSGAAADQGQGFPATFNPFAAVGEQLRELYFTEQLPREASSLQWAMHQRSTAAETSPDRGNLAVALQDQRPSWLSKPAFLEFGSLRAYPLRQLHRLAAALHDRTLPLSHPAVHTLIRQTLYQLGTLTSDTPPRLLFRTGWDQEDDVLPTLAYELDRLAEELEQTPREHDAVLLLGELAAYLAEWHAPCGGIARRFAAMTSRVADELEPRLAEVSNDSDAVSEVLANQCRWRAMALLCYGAGPLDTDDVGNMLQLIALISQGCIFQSSPARQQELSELRVRAHNVMASRIAEVVACVEQRPAILTAAVGRLMSERAPDALLWQFTGYDASSLEAVGGHDGRLYSVNLLNGTVLFDGWPPGRLPKEVTQHPLYVRTFGAWNFEVRLSTDGVMRALRPVRGRYYDFRVSSDGRQLSITEEDRAHGVELELLDAGQDGGCGQWGAELPERLRLLHSHWLCRQQGVILLRPPNFQSHEVDFIIRCSPTPFDGSTSASAPASPVAADTLLHYDCRRVPPHLRSPGLHWTQLLSPATLPELPHRLVLQGSSSLKDTILAKFEDARFVHTYISTSVGCEHELLYELPRFRLEFVLLLKGGSQLLSKDYSGYRLHRRQLLVQESGARNGTAAAAAGGPLAADIGAAATAVVQYTLPEFRRYLVLERVPDGGGVVVGARRTDMLVLVPQGEVITCGGVAGGGVTGGGGGLVDVVVAKDCNARLDTHCYEVHGRFGHLTASSDLARLQLAALYAATSTLLPEPGSAAIGAQTAMRLLRGCWRNRPFTPQELAQLRSVAQLGGHLAAGLRLLVHELEASASSLSHLHVAAALPTAPGVAVPVPSPPPPPLHPDAGICYQQESRRALQPGGWGPDPRLLLTRGELTSTLGTSRSTQPPPAWKRLGQYRPIQLAEALPVDAAFVVQTEEQLCRLVMVAAAPRSVRRAPPYPLLQDPSRGGQGAAAAAAALTAATPLERAMHAELQESWEAHHALPSLEEMTVEPGVLCRIREIQADVQSRRVDAEVFLRRHLSQVPKDVGCHGAAFRLLRLSGAQPSASLLDLLRAAWQPELLLQFNPFLTPEARQRLHCGVLVWLQLCVLEDRLGRLEALAAGGAEYQAALIQELQVRRTWDPAAHPQWLAFEAEGRLQIRPQQHAIARHLLEHPHGDIAQLNMGEGKTRVILPMLVLQLADGSRVVRLNLLSTLLEEAYAHLQTHLAAGVLGRKLFTLPFHRDVKVTAADARAMKACLRYCQQEGGMLLVAPEHRLSLQLKWHELWAAGQDRAADCTALGELADLPYLDLLDESDELLHHRYQLIYACGAPGALPAIQERSTAVQALLRIASHLAWPPPDGSGRLGGMGRDGTAPLLPTSAAALEPPAGRELGAFCGLRLLPGEALSAATPGLHARFAKELLQNPPYELRWLRNHPLRDRILRCITDVREDAGAILGPDACGAAPGQLSADQEAVVLSLRGLLGCSLLQHCLQKRHRVEYGVDRRGSARKRMAVPFRAAHTPSERSEFAQPDVALLLTNLAYYYDGLSREEFQAALRALLGMGRNAQADYYREWLALSRPGVREEDLLMMDSAAKIDTSNAQQMDVMYGYFRHNMAVVDFWLNQCVYPLETRQFPQRLAASAWHLAENANRQVVGFSGTNDNHRLLPLQVRQAALQEAALRATNGKMLAVILDTTAGYTTLPREDGGRPVWKVLLNTAVRLGLGALLDCGALLAGASNREAAAYLLPLLDRERFQGVTYFDESPGMRCWAVVDLRGRTLPRHASPIAERETFAIFDDARCRGADLQLRRDAVGLLTLGPGACKDKLMQAAGRLRQLGRGQRLHFAATPDVSAKIQQYSTGSGGQQQQQPSVKEVLRWVMANTVTSTLRGVPQWAAQGWHFAATHGAPERALHNEVLELAALYGGSKVEQRMDERLTAAGDAAAARAGLARPMQELALRIAALGAEYGRDATIVVGGAADDEECERELEEEEEEEQEVEKQLPRATAAHERDWDYATALSSDSPERLDPKAGTAGLQRVARLLQPRSLADIAWSPQVLCTANFLHATAGVPAGAPVSEYLRPVDAVLMYPGGHLLLLSEREADQLLALLWSRGGGGSSGGPRCSLRLGAVGGVAPGAPVLANLCYARLAFTQAAPALAAPLSPAGTGVLAGWLKPRHHERRHTAGLGAAQLVSAQLFNGEASYGSEAQRRELRALVWRRREDAEALVGMRGKQALLPRSDLEKACEDPTEA